MTDERTLIDVMDARVKRREDRRDFFIRMGGSAFLSAGAALTGTTAAQAQAAPTDNDILNFALNLEYLEAQFYSYAAFDRGLNANLLTGTGTQGAVDASGARAVNFTDITVREYAREIANDEIAHVQFLRTALRDAAVSQPAIDISTRPNGAFSSAARAANLIPALGTPGAPQNFDPYADENSFLLGAFIFEDVGVTAYKGASPLITSRVFLEAAAGLLAVEAYHASIVRTVLFARGLKSQTEQISNARDSLDGMSDIDQGVLDRGPASNIVPLDADGLAFSRTTGQVLNIVYLNRAAVSAGGFFPAGVNGMIRASAPN